MWGEGLARLAGAAGAVVTVLALVLTASGASPNQGRLLGEFHWGFDLALLVFYLVPLTVALRTIAKRKVESIYISVWYVVGGLIWLVGLTAVGANPWIGGVGSALTTSFYTVGMVGLWSVGVGIGAAYYLIPRVTDNPLFSRPLALAGFWSLAFAQVWTGPAAMIYGPAANWIESVAIIFTMGMIVPGLAVLANFIGTLQGKWSLVRERSDLRFAVAGAVVLVFLSFVSSAEGFRSVASVVGLTQFSTGTRYGLLYGAASMLAAAFLYYALPQAFGRQLYSETAGRRQLQLMFWGVGGVTIFTWLAGLAAGYTWLAGAYTGAFASVGEGFAHTLSSTRTLGILALLAVLVVATAQIIMVLNLWRTVTSGAAAPQEVLVEAA